MANSQLVHNPDAQSYFAFSHDNSYLTTVGSGSTLHVYDCIGDDKNAVPTLIYSRSESFYENVSACDFLVTNDELCAYVAYETSVDGMRHFYSVVEKRTKKPDEDSEEYCTHVFDRPIRSIGISPDGLWIAAGGDAHYIIARRMEEEKKYEFNDGKHSDSILSLRFSKDSTKLASFDASGTLVLWTINKKESPTFLCSTKLPIDLDDVSRSLLPDRKRFTYSMEWNESSDMIAVAHGRRAYIVKFGLDSKISLARTIEQIRPTKVILNVQWTKLGSSNILITAGLDQACTFYNAQTGEVGKSVEELSNLSCLRKVTDTLFVGIDINGHLKGANVTFSESESVQLKAKPVKPSQSLPQSQPTLTRETISIKDETLKKKRNDPLERIVHTTMQIQEPVQPGSTPMNEDSRYLAWNEIGSITVRVLNSMESTSVTRYKYDIEFGDTSNRPYRFEDTRLFHAASLSTQGAVFLHSSGIVHYIPLQSWCARTPWEMSLTTGESAKLVATDASGLVYLLTEPNMLLRILADGIQVSVIKLAQTPISVCVQSGSVSSSLAVFSSISPLSIDCTVYTIHCMTGTIIGSSNYPSLALGSSKLVWVGYMSPDDGVSDQHVLGAFDSAGMLSICKESMAYWQPVLECKDFWPIWMSSSAVSGIESSEGPKQTHPKPLPSFKTLQVPMIYSTQEDIANISKITTYRTMRKLLGDSAPSSLGTASSCDKVLIEMLNAAIAKADRPARAARITSLFSKPKSFDLASQLARHHRQGALADQIDSLKDRCQLDSLASSNNIVDTPNQSGIFESRMMPRRRHLTSSMTEDSSLASTQMTDFATLTTSQILTDNVVGGMAMSEDSSIPENKINSIFFDDIQEVKKEKQMKSTSHFDPFAAFSTKPDDGKKTISDIFGGAKEQNHNLSIASSSSSAHAAPAPQPSSSEPKKQRTLF